MAPIPTRQKIKLPDTRGVHFITRAEPHCVRVGDGKEPEWTHSPHQLYREDEVSNRPAKIKEHPTRNLSITDLSE